MTANEKSVLVVDRHLPYVQARLGESVGRWAPVRDAGLVRGEVPAEDYERLQGQLREQRSVWGPALAEDRPMRAAFVAPPRPALVRGSPMDFHGGGAPLPSVRRLPPRRGDRQLGEGVLVGVVDTGMRSHPWLAGGYLASPQDFEPYDEHGLPEGPRDQAGHGTFVTGLVLQQAQAAGVWVERALEPQGVGLASAVAEAAVALARRGVHVLNLSLGCYDDEPGARQVMERMVEQLHTINPRMVIVASAGNLGGPDGQQEPTEFWPAVLPGVVAVGAVERDEADGPIRWSKWSNRGPWVDLAAPGSDLLSTYLYDRRGIPGGEEQAPTAQASPPDAEPLYRGWARWSGTSFSAAVVSGAIAAVMDELGETAGGAVEYLRQGRRWPDTTTEPEGDVPAVPVVPPVDWSGVLAESGDEPAAAAT